MSYIMSVARNLAKSGGLEVGKAVRQTTKNGTLIEVLNKGHGLFEKTVTKLDGRKFVTQLDANNAWRQMDIINERGAATITREMFHGVQKGARKVVAKIKGLDGKFTFGQGFDDFTSKKIERFIVQNRPGMKFDNFKDAMLRYLKQGYLFSEKSGCWPSWSEATGALDRVGQEVKDAITFVRIP